MKIKFEIVINGKHLWIYVLQTIYLHLILIKNYDIIKKYLENKEKTVIIRKGYINNLFNKFFKTFIMIAFVLLLNLHLNHLLKLFKDYNISSCLFRNFTEKKNLSIILYWIALLIFSFIFIEKICTKFAIQKILKRKCYHILIFLIYLPALKFMQYDFILLISVLILYLFLFLEVIRNRIKNSIFENISLFLMNNIDERDDSKFILTHTFLLSGCFSSFILSETNNMMNFNNDLDNLKKFNLGQISIEKFIGLITLGIGDAFVIINSFLHK